ncbi:MAG: rhomboid family intramembrane serine protease [Leptospiraceae bacterium]|nr:rhomboid family intramembrane serine protease [Leptospiraceae bacterium]MCP5499990.1 rhomboid family intramembrane serine protease [Leptospiraceae bacterium]
MDDDKWQIKTSFLYSAIFVVTLWLIKSIENQYGYDFSKYGIFPRTLGGLKGIFLSPLIHGDINHLLSNTAPTFVLLFGILYLYRKVSVSVFVIIYLFGNIIVWLFARSSYHIGASGLVYGFFFFIFLSGVIRRERRAIALSLLAVFLYGGMVWGVLPLEKGVSYEGHLSGAVIGSILAILYRNVARIEPQDEKEELEPEWEEEIWGNREE